jgi:competence ComEA-like helix-hairpin-helix protein
MPQMAQAVSGRLNINQATRTQLQELPYIGEKKAAAIISYRKSHGPFNRLDDLLLIDDIGQKTFAAIKSYLTISGPSTIAESAPTPVGRSRLRKKIITQPGQIIIQADKEYYKTLTSLIQHARHSIDMVMFIFKTTSSPKNKPVLLVKELARAAKRKIRIRVILEKSNYDDKLNKENQKVAKKLRKNGIKVIFDNPRITTHAKLVVVDNRYCLVGSHNLTHSALAYNHELSLLVDSRILAAELLKYIDGIKN